MSSPIHVLLADDDALVRAALTRMLAGTEDIPKGILDRLRSQVEWRTFSGWEKLGPTDGDEAPTRALARLRREMVDAERSVFVQLRDSGELDEDVLRMIQRRLDLDDLHRGAARAARERQEG